MSENNLQTISFIRVKMILLSYLMQLPEYFGFITYSPFLNFDIVTKMLKISDERKENRIWQTDFFAQNNIDLDSMNLKGTKSNTLDLDTFNQWLPVIDDLSKGIDNRREIVTFYHPGTMELACLPPCVHTHTFSLLNGYLYLTSYQRSADMPLGVPFNMIQTAWLLYVVAHVTGNKAGAVFHKIVNAHIYEDQIDIMQDQLKLTPLSAPSIEINSFMNTWQDLVENSKLDDFEILNYRSHPAIKYPFSV